MTEDGSLAAHFEHTIAVTEAGPEVLTADATEAADARRGAAVPKSARG